MNPTPEKVKPTLATPASRGERPDQKQLWPESSTARCGCGWPGPGKCPICQGGQMVWLHWGRL